MILDPLLFDEEHHAQALEQRAIRALGSGDFKSAFQYADRRCRILPIAQPHHYTLRAEASHHRGAPEDAIADLERALALAPDDLIANRRMLAWGAGVAKLDAARRLVRNERDTTVLASAIEELRQSGEPAVAAIYYTDSEIYGWAAWSGKSKLTIAIVRGDEVANRISADPGHALSDCLGNAADFTFKRTKSTKPTLVSVRLGRRTVFEKRIRAVPSRNAIKAVARRPGEAETRSDPTTEVGLPLTVSTEFAGYSPLVVIVPIYGDYEATKVCLDSLLLELERCPHSRAILVDDASPDLRIKTHLQDLKHTSSIELLVNSHNLGFVGSTNLALAQVKESDVILLNADTVLPPGCLVRLREASRAIPGIGTVTPLSNNGEFTSLPVPNKPNPIFSTEKIHAVDEIAATANSGVLVDIPNGTGFCLYITRECLSVVGALSDAYYRGYLEDVDFCLRAREHGFRNVCAPSVYIGHVGSRSFGTEKRSLVMQNMAVLEARFPLYRAECAAFVSADPLRKHRSAIEVSLPPEPRPILLVAGSGALAATAKARAETLVCDGVSVLMLETRAYRTGPGAYMIDSEGKMPQSLRFSIHDATELESLGNYLDRAQLKRIEIVDPAHVPGKLLNLLLGIDVPLDLLIADGGLVCPRGTLRRPDGRLCRTNSQLTCAGCIPLYEEASGPNAISEKTWRTTWANVVRQADRILVSCDQAQMFARHEIARQSSADFFRTDISSNSGNETSRRRVDLTGRTTVRGLSLREGDSDRDNTVQSRGAFGILTLGADPVDYELMRDIIRELSGDSPAQPIIVLGKTIDDLNLMALDNVFVTGVIGVDEFAHVLSQYSIGRVFIATRRPIFGHPIIIRLSSEDIPTAFLIGPLETLKVDNGIWRLIRDYAPNI